MKNQSITSKIPFVRVKPKIRDIDPPFFNHNYDSPDWCLKVKFKNEHSCILHYQTLKDALYVREHLRKLNLLK